ncbi:MAG: 16S rRNA (guanine(966)-N(2))-methyltransferase RsmD [Gammaproteobacteria bacterium]|nr:MAG: 16S rRNA (guanine(966)-N(2))-methyltransferase RsmD [Gammaproteobacteria bacterium]RKZ41182.1 MAG: 16S rRNA (guanine(966)-N(2))-methyltransferase RsmD [Gammaproteobacteria bacterium]RKZ73564.1 MAG: 16S rRNA (guanine(966)-N(2))-methyltransferase RsmD [Gammaproteobacteria bacterium]
MNGKIRIIGGQWRGRMLLVQDKPGLRPTSNRVRETLFNWLTMQLPGSRCLDLFAGTGALGIEAASRGAKQIYLVEKERDMVQNLRQQVAKLATDNLNVINTDALSFLKGTASTFDIVFLDPPFGSDLLTPCCTLLEQSGWLNPNAHIYLESERCFGKPSLPATWQIIRRKTAGQVEVFLAKNLPGL